MSRRAVALLLCGLVVTGPVLATSPPAPAVLQKQGQATVSAFAPVGPDGLKIRLSDEVRLLVTVEGKGPLTVDLPEKLTLSEAWSLKPAGQPVTAPLAGGRVQWSQALDLEPLQKGKLILPLEPLHFREGDGPSQEVTWRPIPVAVTTDVVKEDVSEARDNTPIEELPPPDTWPVWLLFVPGVLLTTGLVLIAWILWRRRLPWALPLSPERAALRELDRLPPPSPTSLAEAERYHTRLSGIVRRYLERRFRLPASRRTTSEFLDSMRQSPQLTTEQQELLREFLERCDLAKFAPVTPSAGDCRQTAGLARTFIEQTGEPPS